MKARRFSESCNSGYICALGGRSETGANVLNTTEHLDLATMTWTNMTQTLAIADEGIWAVSSD